MQHNLLHINARQSPLHKCKTIPFTQIQDIIRYTNTRQSPLHKYKTISFAHDKYNTLSFTEMQDNQTTCTQVQDNIHYTNARISSVIKYKTISSHKYKTISFTQVQDNLLHTSTVQDKSDSRHTPQLTPDCGLLVPDLRLVMVEPVTLGVKNSDRAGRRSMQQLLVGLSPDLHFLYGFFFCSFFLACLSTFCHNFLSPASAGQTSPVVCPCRKTPMG